MVSKKEIKRRIEEAKKLGMTIPEYMKYFRKVYQKKKQNSFSYPDMKDLICPRCGLFNCVCETSYDHANQDYMNDLRIKHEKEIDIDPDDELTGEIISGG